MSAKKKKGLRIGLLLFVLCFIASAFLFFHYYGKIFKAAVKIKTNQQELYIYSDWSRKDLVNFMFKENIISDTSSFVWVANRKEFYKIKPGRYILKSGMSNNTLINLLRSGNQSPVQFILNGVRDIKDLCEQAGSQLELHSDTLYKLLRSKSFIEKYGFNRNTIITLFLPNTYEFYWNTSAEEFVSRMAKEYKRFWTTERIAKAKQIGLSQSEVAILASIVQAEQSAHPDERAKVAGLYINRLKKGIRLQSDPTLIYAIGDYSIRRVLNKHKAVDSPYNTYKYLGLPPGPINLPEIASLDAVLNYEKHNYLYMCAKADFSGYHEFASSLKQHNIYANKFRRELNKRGILK